MISKTQEVHYQFIHQNFYLGSIYKINKNLHMRHASQKSHHQNCLVGLTLRVTECNMFSSNPTNGV